MVTDVLVPVVVVLFLTLLMRAAKSARASVDAATGTRVARYSGVFRALGWFFVICGVGVCAIALKVAASITLAVTICVITTAPVSAMWIEFMRIRVSWAETAVVLHSPWRGVRTIQWTDLTDVRFSQAAGWFVLRDRAGEVIRLSMWLGGLTELLQDLRSRAPANLWPQIDDSVSNWKNRSR